MSSEVALVIVVLVLLGVGLWFFQASRMSSRPIQPGGSQEMLPLSPPVAMQIPGSWGGLVQAPIGGPAAQPARDRLTLEVRRLREAGFGVRAQAMNDGRIGLLVNSERPPTDRYGQPVRNAAPSPLRLMFQLSDGFPSTPPRLTVLAPAGHTNDYLEVQVASRALVGWSAASSVADIAREVVSAGGLSAPGGVAPAGGGPRFNEFGEWIDG